MGAWFDSRSATSLGCLVAVALLSIPHTRCLVRRFVTNDGRYQSLSSVYEDKDGIATARSERASSSTIQRIILAVSVTFGVLAALGSSVRVTSGEDISRMAMQWLQFAGWILVLCQECVLITTPSFRDRYRLGVWSALACLLLGIAAVLANVLEHEVTPGPHTALTAVKSAASVILTLGNVSIPRRPDVYHDETPVDRQYTASLLSRFTFSWPGPILTAAKKTGRLEPEDLPAIAYDVRAQGLSGRFHTSTDVKLWKRILRVHKRVWILQLVVQIFGVSAHFLPQIFMFKVLRLLERREKNVDDAHPTRLWLLTAGLGLSLLISSWLETLLEGIVTMQLGLPIREQLSAIIFEKAMRLKGAVQDGGEKPDSESDDDDEDDDDGPPNSKQSITNLLGVDVEKISQFAKLSHRIVDSGIKAILAVLFLINILGLLPVLCGLAIPAICTPLNYYVTKKYSEVERGLMTARDSKMATITEALRGIRQIKFSAQETQWRSKILGLRSTEMEQQKKAFDLTLALFALWTLNPICMTVVCLISYVLFNGVFPASVVFTSITIFESLASTLATLPETVTDLLDAKVSARRIEQYLGLSEHQDCTIDGDSIVFHDASVAWPTDDAGNSEGDFKLIKMNLDFPIGELSVISGPTGSGKSLLLRAIIGEADLLEGRIISPHKTPSDRRADSEVTYNWVEDGTLAYVSQIPWIENGTFRDNILFGLPFDAGRYREVLDACALEDDLKTMQDGDMTDIGANGINLSGGQKWRTALARALYSRASLLVFDDIFSAVDAHVGRWLYEKALTGRLAQNRTRILVTHHVDLCLKDTKYSVSLDNGRVLHAAAPRPPGEQSQHNGGAPLLDAVEKEEHITWTANTKDVLTRQRSGSIGDYDYSRRRSSLSVADLDLFMRRYNSRPTNPGRTFYAEEKRETGAIKLSVYSAFFKACGGYRTCIPLAILFGLTLLDSLAAPYWLSLWTREYNEPSGSDDGILPLSDDYSVQRSLPHSSPSGNRLWMYLGVYLGLSILSGVIEIVRYHLLFRASIKASVDLFRQFTTRILRAPLLFLDTTPVGQILNRFSADYDALDSELALDLAYLVRGSLWLSSIVIAALIISPLMVGFGCICILASGYVASVYLTAARDVKRMESNARSPIFDNFNAALDGLVSIRAFDKTAAYVQRMYGKIDAHCQALWHLELFNCWMMFRLNVISAFFVTSTAATIVGVESIDASLAGFALSFALQISETIDAVVSQYAYTEIDFNSVERIVEYTQIETEPQGGARASATWPAEGEIQVQDLVVAYSAESDPVLRGLNFSIRPNEHVGVVGRTGAGKSSLALALFRLLEARSGSVCIDGIDVATLSLQDLRSRIAIIPQDPTLFSGTVRSTLDPFGEHNDDELLEALARVNLGSGSESEGDTGSGISLESTVSEGGENLSQGQRQLLCLALATLRRPKILIMDEATSSIDMSTDALIQQSLKKDFHNSTLIVIAHRLSTIADFDRVMVLDKGKVAEFDTPTNLLQNENGEFHALVEQSDEKDKIRDILQL